uniref:Uncharacterized protein n=1 Tax=Arundo donax TaxID=35708 RepID=A0A0A9GI17_ARUDO
MDAHKMEQFSAPIFCRCCDNCSLWFRYFIYHPSKMIFC